MTLVRTSFSKFPSFFPLILTLILAPSAFAVPKVLKASRHDVSRPLSQLAIQNGPRQAGSDKEREDAFSTGNDIQNPNGDPVATTFAGSLKGVTLNGSFDGQSAADNRRVLGFAFVPPDTNGAAGANQYVQMVNVTIAVYSKTGSLQLGPAPIHTIWTGFGGPCEFEFDGGDPVVVYDQLAKRWLVSQFMFNSTFTQNEQCVAVSTTSDATGTYNRYQFDWGSDFPDYPKYGVWPDAYYNTVNNFGPKSFNGAEACAFDRAAMLSGTDASAVCFQQPSNIGSLLPASVDGSTLPPAGAPNYNLALIDSTHLGLWKFHADFGNPAKSTFTGPQLIEVANFSELCARAQNASCIPQPTPGERVDGLGDRLMFRLAYRNYGDHESLVANHTVKGGDRGAIRWYEIRNPGGKPTVYQQATITDPAVSYWLGSIAQDAVGNTALGFSVSSHDVFPSVAIAGRAATDPPATMFGPVGIVDGSGSQFQSFHRWGDYSAMTIDPTDDCTFWYTQEYYDTNSSFNWKTRVGSFKFDNCKNKGK
jgi:hypothetical protein